MAPDWQVSGNELANAWRSLRGRRLAGVVVIDVVALSELLEVTGPIEVPTLGTLTGDNLVEKLIGSYDDYPDPAARKAVNRALAPVFVERLLSGNDPVGTGRVLGEAADERRFALYFRSPDEQAAFDGLGLTGRLSDTEHDYIGVFTQNKVPSKSDYWQRRTVSTDVALREDGSARVRMEVEVHNDSPPYVQPVPDPRQRLLHPLEHPQHRAVPAHRRRPSTPWRSTASRSRRRRATSSAATSSAPRSSSRRRPATPSR